MGDDEAETVTESAVGVRLRTAREAQGLSLDEVAARTRIPKRHLESMETGAWDLMPAPTYAIGFAKSYASAVGLDRAEIGDQLREEMGGTRASQSVVEEYETADPKRVPPFSLLVIAGIAMILVIGAFLFLREQSVSPDEEPAAKASITNTVAPPTAPKPAAASVTPAASGPVVVTANEPAWVRVTDGGQQLFQAELAAGQSYEVPASATAPMLETGRPEALRIAVGTADAPAIGPAGQKVSGVSLRAADLMRSTPAPGASPATSQPAR